MAKKQYTLKKDDCSTSAYRLHYGDDPVTEVFLITDEETDEDFEDGTKYVKLVDVCHFENQTDEPNEVFFLTQEGCEEFRRTLEA